jgi:putative ABC transport system permease protein
MVGLFAMLALVLAAVDLYGVTAYSVAQRTRELEIRVALGAHRGALLRAVLAHGARLAITGLAVGTLAALALTPLMSTLLFGIAPRDPMTFAGVTILLLIVSLTASFGPAHRATRVDPIVALRT